MGRGASSSPPPNTSRCCAKRRNSRSASAGPFTVESLSPHRVLGVDENDELIDGIKDPKGEYGEVMDFAQMILENLKTSGVQQAHKEDKISFTALTPWPGN